jgi:hypothetical protein
MHRAGLIDDATYEEAERELGIGPPRPEGAPTSEGAPTPPPEAPAPEEPVASDQPEETN